MAAKYTGIMLGKSERTIRQWKANLIENGYEVPESKPVKRYTLVIQGNKQKGCKVCWRECQCQGPTKPHCFHLLPVGE